MIDCALNAKNAGAKLKLTVKSIVSLGVVALAAILPQIFHAVLGAAGGVKWLPMYLPVMIGGCLLGVSWGAGVGALSPLVSFAFTALFGNAMPAAARLPYMMAELAVFGAVCGLFARRIYLNSLFVLPAVLLSAVVGRAAFLTLAAIFQSVSTVTAASAWAQIRAGLVGLSMQCAVAALTVAVIAVALKKNDRT